MRSDERPLITVGITAFDAAATIERAIVSALRQTWRPIEIVVVDDASTDSTRQILDQLADEHSELRVFENDCNLGVAGARNRILLEARGEFVAFFDDDDESVPDRLRIQYERIVSYEKEYAQGAPVICHSARRVTYPNGETRIEETMGQVIGKKAPCGERVAERILLGTPLEDGYGACPTCSQMARTSTYNLVNGFDQNFRRSEDTELNVRLALVGAHFVGIAEPLVVQTMTKSSEKSLRDEHTYLMLMLEKHASYIRQHGQIGFVRQWATLKYQWLTRQYFSFIRSLVVVSVRYPSSAWQRLKCALPYLSLNRAYRRFHDAT